MKKYLLVCLAACTAFTVHAQMPANMKLEKFGAMPKFVWSNGENEFDEMRDVYQFRINDGEMIAITRVLHTGEGSGWTAYFEAHRVKKGDTEKSKGTSINIPQKTAFLFEMPQYFNFIQLGNKIFCVAEYKEKLGGGEIRRHLFAHELDQATLKLVESEKPFYTFSNLTTKKDEKSGLSSLRILQPENSRACDYFILQENVYKPGKCCINFTVFDAALAQTAVIPVADQTESNVVRIRGYSIQDKENFALLVTNIAGNKPGSVLHVIRQNKLSSYSLNVAPGMGEARIGYAGNNIAVGIQVSEKGKPSELYTGVINTLLPGGAYDLTRHDNAELNAALNVKKTGKGVPMRTRLKQVHPLSTGNTLFIFEQEESDPSYLISTHTMHDLLAVCISPDQKISWQATIPKYNEETGTEAATDQQGLMDLPAYSKYISYAALPGQDKIYLFFAEHIENSLEKSTNKAGGKSSGIVRVTLDANGKFTKEFIQKPAGKKSIRAFPVFHQTAGNTWTVMMNDDNNDYFFFDLLLN